MVAENAVMPSAASRSERIIFSFVQLLAGRLLPKNSIRFSPRRAIVLRGNTGRIKFVFHLAPTAATSAVVKSAVLTIGRPLPVHRNEQTFSATVGMSQRCQFR